ncbi:MAG: hypothetical protein ACRC1F_02380 [Metamycoplasmataceae bacterium]
MKKTLLLGIGLSALSLIPIGTMVSCSQSSTTKISLETEAAKFKTVVDTTNPEMTRLEAVDNIQSAPTPELKLEALKAFANVKQLEPGFGFEVISASVNNVAITKVDINIKVMDLEDLTNYENVVYQVEGLMNPSLETESLKFETPAKTIKPEITSTSAVNSINSGIDSKEKLEILETIAIVPKVAYGFGFDVIRSSINTDRNTTIDIIINVFEKANPKNNVDVTFQVTGLRQPAVPFVYLNKN